MSEPPAEAEAPPQQEVQQDDAPAGPARDPILEKVYDSIVPMPLVELFPGVRLSPVIIGCVPPKDTKEMLAENWVPAEREEQAEEDPDAPPPAAFDPTSAEYHSIPSRIAKSFPMTEFNRLTILAKELEYRVRGTAYDQRDKVQAQLDEAQAALAEAEASLADLKVSFAEDPLALVPWMNTLFELADAGCTTFDVETLLYPYAPGRRLFIRENSGSLYDGVEKVLGAFKRRYERERGADKISVTCKFTPNIFADGYSPANLETIVDKIRLNLFGEEALQPEEGAPPSLDLLQLLWMDHAHNTGQLLPTLRAMQSLTENKIEIDEDSGKPVIAEGGHKKVKGFGVVDFPHDAIKSAIQAGIKICTATISYSLADRSQAKVLQLCRAYGVRVFAKGGLMAGLISERYVGAPCPDPVAADPDLDSVPAALDAVKSYGGWDRVQGLLAAVKAVADKHGVKMQTVALRWQMDQGTTPVANMRWTPKCWKQFGYLHWTEKRPGVDAALFADNSFLDAEDMAKLNALA